MKFLVLVTILGAVAITGVVIGFVIGQFAANASREEVLLCKKQAETGQIDCKSLQDWKGFFKDRPNEVDKWTDNGYRLP